MSKARVCSREPLDSYPELEDEDDVGLYDSKKTLMRLAKICSDNASVAVKYRLTVYASRPSLAIRQRQLGTR